MELPGRGTYSYSKLKVEARLDVERSLTRNAERRGALPGETLKDTVERITSGGRNPGQTQRQTVAGHTVSHQGGEWTCSCRQFHSAPWEPCTHIVYVLF